jgi:hypothetical protein
MFLFDDMYIRFRTKVGLQIDNRKCTKNCFKSNEQVANYMAGLKAKGTSLPGDPFRIGKLQVLTCYLHVVNSLFQGCYNNWEQVVRTQLVDNTTC